ncbi:MAG: PhzF family phenazine biosynthesis protein [Pseudomonadales bacterium]|nr:PhzF family phenazine biosynthesis protein [Pseudomonadales bacterium]
MTVDVFTQNTFGGNPLAVFFSAQQLSSQDMQRIAAEMNYSETTFVLPPEDPSNTALIRIFTPKSELPFAGHPNVGTGFVLAAHPAAAPVTGKIDLVSDAGGNQCLMRFEEHAGLVEVGVELNADGSPKESRIRAPQPFQHRVGHSNEEMAQALGLDPKQVVSVGGRSTIVSVGIEFPVVRVSGLDALAACDPQIDAFKRLGMNPASDGDAVGADDAFLVYAYCRAHPTRRPRFYRARMFDPLHGIAEDPATGRQCCGCLGWLVSGAGGLRGQRALRDLSGRRNVASQPNSSGRDSRQWADSGNADYRTLCRGNKGHLHSVLNNLGQIFMETSWT